MDLDIRLGEVNGCVAEGDNGCSGIGIELIKRRELLVAHDSSGLLRTVLEAHGMENGVEKEE
jgi:hypothetical protein